MEQEKRDLGADYLRGVVEEIKTGKCGHLNCRSRLGKSSVSGEIDRILQARCLGAGSRS